MSPTVPTPRSRKREDKSKQAPRKKDEEMVWTAELTVTVRLRGKSKNAVEMDDILKGLVRRGETVVTTADGIELTLIRR